MSENWEKLPVGPTTPSPGPMLFRHAVIAVKFVIKSNWSIEIMRVDIEKIIK